MSIKNVENFLNLAKSNENLQKELILINEKLQKEEGNEEKIIADNVVPLAKKNGIIFTANDFLQYANEQMSALSEEDLLNVSGGANMQQKAIAWLFGTIAVMSAFASGLSQHSQNEPTSSVTTSSESHSSEKNSRNNQDEVNTNAKNAADKMSRPGQKSAVNNKGNEAQAGGNIDRNDNKSYKANGTEQKNRRDVMQNKNVVLPNSNAKNTLVAPQINIAPQANAAKPAAKNNVAQQANAAKNTHQNTEQTTASGTVEKANRTNAAGGLFEIAAKDSRKKSDKSATPEAKVDDNKTNKSEPQATHNKEDQTKKIPTTPKMEDASNPATEAKKKNNVNSETLNKDGKIPTKIKKVDDSSKNIKDKKQKEKKEKENKETKQLEEKNKKVAPPEEKEKETLATPTAKKAAASTTAKEAVGAVREGRCGTNVNWKIEGNVLRIFGEGPMDNYASTKAPWWAARNEITEVVIGPYVTTIGNNAFFMYEKLAKVTIPKSVTSIKNMAFYGCKSLTSVKFLGVPKVGNDLFLGCNALEEVEMPATFSGGSFCGKPVKMAAAPNEEAQPAEPSVTIDVQDQIENENKEAEPKVSTDNKNGAAPTEEAAPGALEDDSAKAYGMTTAEEIHAFAEHLRNDFKLGEFFDEMSDEEGELDEDKEEYKKLDDFFENCEFSKIGGTWHGCDVSVDDVKTLVSYASQIFNVEYEEDNSTDCATYAESAQAFLDKYGLEALKACAAELREKINNGETEELPEFFKEKIEKFADEAEKLVNFYTEQGIHAFAEHLRNGFKLDEFFDKMRGENETVKDAGKEEFTKLLDFVINGKFSKEGGTWHGCDVSVDDVKTFVSYANEIIELEYEEDNSIDCATYAKSAQAFLDKYGLEALKACAAELKKKIDNGELDELPNFLAEKVEKFLADANKIIEAEERKAAQGDDQEESAVSSATIDVQDQNDNGNKSEEGSQNNDVTNKGQDDNDNGNAEEAEQEEVNSAKAPVIFYNLLDEDDDAADDDDTEKTESEIQKLAKNVKASATAKGDTAKTHEGKCGENVTWKIEGNVLHIFGKGDMQDYDDDENKAPWHAYKNEITEVVIGPDVTTIGDDAFSGCSSLTFVNIPEGVTAIGDYAFSGCSSLTSVNIPEGVTAIGDYAFSGCSSLTSVKIPDGVTKIEKTTFHGCSSLTSIEIPETVEFIEDYAFFDCSSLTSIKIPDNVANIGIHAFEGCSSLTSIKIPANVKKISFTAFSGCSSLTSVTIPEGAETIERWAFSGCSSLKSITIPASVKTIADEAFKDCSSLTSVKFLGVPSGKEYVFKLCTALKEVEMPADYKGKTFCNKPVKTAAPEEEKSSALVDSVKDNEAAESEVSSTTIDVQGQNDNDNENKEVGVKEAAQPAMLSTNLNQSSKELDSDDKFDKMLDEMDKDEDEQKQSSKFIKQNKETDDDIIDDENEDQDDNNDEINDEIIDDDEIDNEESIYNGEEDELRGAMNEDQNDNDNKNDEEAVPEEKSPEFNASGTLEAADRPDAGGSEKSDSQQAENAEAAKPEQKAYNEKIDRSSTTPQLHEVRHFYDFLKSIEDENEVVDFDAITSETVNDFKDDAQYVVTLLNSNEALRNNFGEDETDYIKYQLEDYVDISQVNDDDSNKSSVNYAEVDDDETPNWVDRNDLDKEQDEFSIEYRKIDRSKTKTKAQLGEINGFYNFLKLIENENGVVDVDAITPETVDDFEDDAQYVVTLLNSNEALRNNFGEDETGYIKSQLKGHVDVDQANYKKAGAYRASTQLDHFVDFLQKYHVSPETQETWEEELDDLDSKIRISGTKNDQPIYALYGGMKTYTNIPQKKLLFVKDLAKGVKYETWNKGFTLNLFSLVANNMLANQAEHLIGFLKKLPKIKRNLPDLSKVSRATHTKLINDIIEVGSQVKVDNQAEYMNSSNPNNKKVLCLSGRVFKNSDQSQQDLYMLRDLYRFFSQEEEISDEDDRFEEEYDKLTNEHREETQSKFIKKKVIDDDDRIDDDEDSDQVRKVAVADTVGGQEDGININDINATWKELTTYKEKEVSEDGKVEEIVKTFKEFEGQTIISYLKDKVPKAEDGLPDISAITRRNILVSYKIKFRNILEFYRKLINEIGRNIIVEDGIIYFLNSELVDGLKLTDDNLEMMLNLYYKQNNDALEFLKSLPQKKDGSADLSKGDPKLVDKLVPAINLLGEQIVYDEEVGQYKLVGEKLKKDWFGDIQVDKKTEYIKIFDFSQDDLKLLYETREALPEEQKVSFVKILNDLPKTKEEDLPDLNQVADPTTAMYLINSALSLSEQITQNRDGNYSISDEARDRFNLTDDDVKTIKILGDRQAEIEKSYNRKQMAIGIAQGLGLAAGTTVAAWAATGAPTVAGMTFLGDGSIENAKKNAKDMYKGSKLESAVNKVKSSYEGSKLESGVNKVTSTVTEVAEKAKSFKNWWYGIDEGTSPNSLNTENFNPLGQTYTTGDLSPAQLEQMFLEGQNAIKDSGTTPVDTPHIASEGQTSATGDFTVDQLNQTFLEGQKSIHTQNIEANGKTSTTEGVLPLSPNTLKVEGFDSLGKTLSETIPEHQKMSTNLLNNNFNPGGQTPSEIIPEHQKMSTNLLNANNFNPRGQTPAEEPPINVANEVIDNRVDSGKRIDSRFLTPSNPEKVNISNGTVDLPKGGPPKAEVHKSGTQVDNTVRGEKKLNDVDAKMIQNPDMNLGEAEKTGYSTSNWSEGNYIKLGKRDSEIAKSSTKAEVPKSTLTPKKDANAAKIFNEYTSTGSTQVDAPHDNANAKTPSDLPPMTPKEVKKSLSKPVSKSEKLDATKVNPELTEQDLQNIYESAKHDIDSLNQIKTPDNNITGTQKRIFDFEADEKVDPATKRLIDFGDSLGADYINSTQTFDKFDLGKQINNETVRTNTSQNVNPTIQSDKNVQTKQAKKKGFWNNLLDRFSEKEEPIELKISSDSRPTSVQTPNNSTLLGTEKEPADRFERDLIKFGEEHGTPGAGSTNSTRDFENLRNFNMGDQKSSADSTTTFEKTTAFGNDSFTKGRSSNTAMNFSNQTMSRPQYGPNLPSTEPSVPNEGGGAGMESRLKNVADATGNWVSSKYDKAKTVVKYGVENVVGKGASAAKSVYNSLPSGEQIKDGVGKAVDKGASAAKSAYNSAKPAVKDLSKVRSLEGFTEYASEHPGATAVGTLAGVGGLGIAATALAGGAEKPSGAIIGGNAQNHDNGGNNNQGGPGGGVDNSSEESPVNLKKLIDYLNTLPKIDINGTNLPDLTEVPAEDIVNLKEAIFDAGENINYDENDGSIKIVDESKFTNADEVSADDLEMLYNLDCFLLFSTPKCLVYEVLTWNVDEDGVPKLGDVNDFVKLGIAKVEARVKQNEHMISNSVWDYTDDQLSAKYPDIVSYELSQDNIKKIVALRNKYNLKVEDFIKKADDEVPAPADGAMTAEEIHDFVEHLRNDFELDEFWDAMCGNDGQLDEKKEECKKLRNFTDELNFNKDGVAWNGYAVEEDDALTLIDYTKKAFYSFYEKGNSIKCAIFTENVQEFLDACERNKGDDGDDNIETLEAFVAELQKKNDSGEVAKLPDFLAARVVILLDAANKFIKDKEKEAAAASADEDGGEPAASAPAPAPVAAQPAAPAHGLVPGAEGEKKPAPQPKPKKKRKRGKKKKNIDADESSNVQTQPDEDLDDDAGSDVAAAQKAPPLTYEEAIGLVNFLKARKNLHLDPNKNRSQLALLERFVRTNLKELRKKNEKKDKKKNETTVFSFNGIPFNEKVEDNVPQKGKTGSQILQEAANANPDLINES